MVATATTTKENQADISQTEIPKSLIYELWDGKPVYYHGYRDVLNKTKTLEEIMGCSSLQAIIIEYLLRIFFPAFPINKFHVLTNEIGMHIDHKNNLTNDLAIYERSILTAKKINTHYTDVSPRFVVEVDIKAEISDFNMHDFEYISTKTNKLFKFGTEKVFWVLTATKKVIIAEANQKTWIISDWNTDIEFIKNVSFNIGAFLDELGIEV